MYAASQFAEFLYKNPPSASIIDVGRKPVRPVKLDLQGAVVANQLRFHSQ